MGQRLIISEEERSQINKMYGLNEQSSTSGYKWSKPQTSAQVCIKWTTIGGEYDDILKGLNDISGEKHVPSKKNRICKKHKNVKTIYLDPVTIETQEFPQLSKLMNHFILNPNSMKENFENIFSKIDFEKTSNKVGFDLPNIKKMYNNFNKFARFIEDEVKKMNVELNKDKERPNLKPEKYHFGNYRQVLGVMNEGLKKLETKNPVDIQNMRNKLKK